MKIPATPANAANPICSLLAAPELVAAAAPPLVPVADPDEEAPEGVAVAVPVCAELELLACAASVSLAAGVTPGHFKMHVFMVSSALPSVKSAG